MHEAGADGIQQMKRLVQGDRGIATIIARVPFYLRCDLNNFDGLRDGERRAGNQVVNDCSATLAKSRGFRQSARRWKLTGHYLDMSAGLRVRRLAIRTALADGAN